MVVQRVVDMLVAVPLQVRWDMVGMEVGVETHIVVPTSHAIIAQQEVVGIGLVIPINMVVQGRDLVDILARRDIHVPQLRVVT